eukprot:g32088.t2
MAAQTIGVKDASTKVTATVTKGARTRIPCMLCRRWFPSAAHLKRHEKHSDLHRSNMEKQDEVTYQRKAELKLAVHCLRSRIVEMDGDERDWSLEGQSHRTLMEMQLRQLLFEYGQAQETIEDGRPHRSSKKRRGPSATKGALQQEKQVGRLALMAGAASWQGNKDVQEDRQPGMGSDCFMAWALLSAVRIKVAAAASEAWTGELQGEHADCVGHLPECLSVLVAQGQQEDQLQ